MAGGGACVCIFSQFVLVVFPVNSIATTANELLAKSAACSQEMRKCFFTNGSPTDPQGFCDTWVLLLILDSFGAELVVFQRNQTKLYSYVVPMLTKSEARTEQ